MNLHETEVYLRDKLNEIQVIVMSIEIDALKACKGNKAAGIRARKGLRMLKNSSADFIRTSVEHEKNIDMLRQTHHNNSGKQ